MRPVVRGLLAHVKDVCFAFESGSLASLAFWRHSVSPQLLLAMWPPPLLSASLSCRYGPLIEQERSIARFHFNGISTNFISHQEPSPQFSSWLGLFFSR